MLVKCRRLKKIYIKVGLGLLLLGFVLIVYMKQRDEKQDIGVKDNLVISENKLEQRLSEWESKIILGKTSTGQCHVMVLMTFSVGLGDNGEPAFLDGDDATEGEKSQKKFALNTVLSDRMPLDRKLRDPRNSK